LFDADRPILSSAQDKLGRTVFAKYLARCMLDHKYPESLVIGLFGGWGVGKTSIINLTLEELRAASSNMLDEEKPIILNFSPWSYSGQNQLIYSFFRRLSSEIWQFPEFEHSKKIIYLLELYISYFTHKPIPVSFRPKFSGFKKDYYGWESGRDLTQVKAELNALLTQQKRKFIIFIDNISRIQEQEVREIFQIVKSIGDFSNTVYLLSCDKEQVIRTINHLQGSGGTEYIDKIIQLPFDVTPIAKQELENILFDRLNKIIQTLSTETWNKAYWTELYYSLLKDLFTNCRDITRYVNTLSFGFLRIKEVVNPVDFFAITAIGVFEPDVYYGIRDNKDLFTDLMDTVYRLDKDAAQKDRLRCDEIINRAKTCSYEKLKIFLIQLFPRLLNVYEITTHFYHSEEIARKNLRICSPDTFDIYFRLSIPQGHIPDAEMTTILQQTSNRILFSEALARLNQDDKIIKFLDQLDTDFLSSIPTNNISNVVSAILDDGDLFPQGQATLLSFNTPMHIHRICHHLLKRFKTSDERAAILKEAISSSTKSLYIIIHELSEQNREHQETEDTYLPVEHRNLSPENLFELKKLAIEKIKVWEASGRLAEHPKLFSILLAWQKWGDEYECRNYVESLTKTDKGIIAFLCSALETPIQQTITFSQKDSDWGKYVSAIETLIPIANLKKHARKLFEDGYFEKLREPEQLALLIFLDLTHTETTKLIPKTSV